MAITRNIGGDRVGSGAKMQVKLHGFERSNHDLGYLWRSSMAPGVLVPFMSKVILPGDTFDIQLDAQAMTIPTQGPLLGSFKLQLDLYKVPIRLYNGLLHNNKTGIGMNMERVKLPQLKIKGNSPDWDSEKRPEQTQINPSSLLAYLGIRGLGRAHDDGEIERLFNAIPYLAYYDIGKNYYTNKQEEIAAVIHTGEYSDAVITNISIIRNWQSNPITEAAWPWTTKTINQGDLIIINGTNLTINNIRYKEGGWTNITEEYWKDESVKNDEIRIERLSGNRIIYEWETIKKQSIKPTLNFFPIENLDKMREDILAQTRDPNAFIIDKNSIEPYSLPLKEVQESETHEITSKFPMEGLMVKTYQSDKFNNWLNSEWIERINANTSIDVTGGMFTMDDFVLSKKVWELQNRIAVSGGSYNDWIVATWGVEGDNMVESPIYMGGLSKEIVFQEVTSTADTGEASLGALGGKGVLAKKHKGGKAVIKSNVPAYVIGIVSITPRIDYCQGNEWDVNLKNMEELHKPNLDGIGFQDLITEQMMAVDTIINSDGSLTQFTAGKLPAWMDYMTDTNKVYGNFADPQKEGFMVLTRDYGFDHEQPGSGITDLTTYVDPSKHNGIFATNEITDQNFWIQIAVDLKARRKMSAKLMPHL